MEKNKIQIKEINNEKVWEKFNINRDTPAFFQSWQMGEVEKKKGNRVLRFVVVDNKKLIGTFQIFEIKAKRGHFFHIRQGPILKYWNKTIVSSLVNFLKILGKKHDISYIRISPLIHPQEEGFENLKKLQFRESPIHNVDAENRWVLRLDQDEDIIFKNMRKTTRYLIKKAQLMNIKIVRSKNMNDINKFSKIYKETTKLKRFVPHGFIKEEFETFVKDNKAMLYFAKLNNQLLSSAMIVYYGNEAIYRHSGNTLEGRKTPASYLLQWEAIKDAKKEGQSIYNFWGIAKDDNLKGAWYGLSQFKKGFGGERIDFIHSLDLPLRYTYWISFIIDFITKIKKGYA